MAIRSRYQYAVEISYISSETNKEQRIVPQSIEYITTSYDYENAIMPYLCIKIKLDASIYNNMVKDQDKGKLYLNIKKYNINGTSSMFVSYINDQFDYIMSDNPNTVNQLDKLVEGKGQAYKLCIIGLYKKELTANNQKQFNGIYKNTTMSSLVINATSHMKMLIEPFKYNTTIESINIQAIPTVMQYLAYLNNKFNFYGDQYMYFMDFNMTYLKSNSGKYIDAKDNQYPYVAIDIRDMTDYKSNTVGMITDDEQKAYIIYVDAADASIHPDRITPQTSANIATINSNAEMNIQTIDTSMIVNTVPNLDSMVYVKSDDPNNSEYIANTLKNSAVTIIINKTELDAMVLTPNKEYLISNYSGNGQYTGRYYMSFKKELFQNNGMYFTYGASIGLRMVIHY